LFDVSIAIFFIVVLPILIFLKKQPVSFYKNVFDVLTGKKTWIGYATMSGRLPMIKPAVITSTALPALLNELPVDSLQKNDEWYASVYSPFVDLKKITRGFKYLHY